MCAGQQSIGELLAVVMQSSRDDSRYQLDPMCRAQIERSDMRQIGFSLVFASLVVAIGCSTDVALAPKTGRGGQLDFPSDMFAAYSLVSLPGTETVVALNDSG